MSASIGTAWVEAVGAAGGRPGPAADSAADLVRRYGEPHRRYHNAVHVAAVLRDSGALADATGLDDAGRTAVALGACAHDVVYDARPGDDEQASAQWAREALRAAGVSPRRIEPVAQLILATMTHDAHPNHAHPNDAHPNDAHPNHAHPNHTHPNHTAAAVLLDADLAILASPPDAYAAYVRAVRAEYAAVDDAGWRSGRAAVLTGLLERPRLYLTEPGRDRWEDAARANVGAELAQLIGAF